MNTTKAEGALKTVEVFDDHVKNEIHRVACDVLKGASENKGMGLKLVLPKVTGQLPDIPEYLVYRTLLEASRSELSPVQSGGPWKGYYLDQSKVAVPEEETTVKDEPTIEVGKDKLREKDLYPLVSFWMKAKKDYKLVSHEVASLRRGNVWSNPDVVALNPIDRLGFFDVEIISAEVKLEDRAWRQFIFEAVSHRRYADRSYFIYRSSRGVSTLDPEMFVYAEKFGVGIAVIELPDDKVSDLQRWSELKEAERLEFADSIVEVVPARKDPVPVKEKCEFLGNINITHKDELHRFGAN